MDRHRVFISFHSEDMYYKNNFERLFCDVIEGQAISNSVQDGDIGDGLKTDTIRQIIRDKYLRDSSVTIVLVGANTWQRKHVDWEISASIRGTEFSPRSGLLGILLPTYKRNEYGNYLYETIPPRLADNIKKEYAIMIDWTENRSYIQQKIHEAYKRKSKIDPDNSFPAFAKNRSGNKWQR